MFRRPMLARRGPGLLNTVARTAVIAGTATVTSSAITGHQQKKAYAAQQQQAESSEIHQLEQQVAQLQADQIHAQVPIAAAPVAAAPVAAAPAQSDLLSQLQQLVALKDQGALTEAEFEAAKAAILG